MPEIKVSAQRSAAQRASGQGCCMHRARPKDAALRERRAVMCWWRRALRGRPLARAHQLWCRPGGNASKLELCVVTAHQTTP